MPKTILCMVADDRQGRKDGTYGKIMKNVAQWFRLHYAKSIEVHDWDLANLAGLEVWANPIFRHIDAGINGRAYKPAVIHDELSYLKDGDFLIYNDCSPEIWAGTIEPKGFDFEVIKDLTRQNNDILTCFVKWDCQAIPHNGLGLHIHKYFTTDRCMDKMGLRQYENSYQHASGMICIRKTPETVAFVEEWLKWNLDPECASLGTESDEFWQQEAEHKIGHRHDQSISGLLLNKRNAKLVDILYNDINPYNFLQYCRIGQEYKFIDSNATVNRGDMDFTKVFIRRGSWVVNEQGVQLKVWAVEGDRIIVGQFEESAWATSRDKLRLVR